MKAIILEMPEEWLEERHRLDLDRKDEMWDGVLHMVPPASSAHGEVENDLSALFSRAAKKRGLRRISQPGIFDPKVPGMTSYRVPDLAYARPGDVTERGIEGRALLVVEVLSPGDDSYKKLSFYRRLGVEELLYIDPTTKAFEVSRPEAEGWGLVGADDDGWTTLDSLDVALQAAPGRLRVRTDLGIEEV